VRSNGTTDGQKSTEALKHRVQQLVPCFHDRVKERKNEVGSW